MGLFGKKEPEDILKKKAIGKHSLKCDQCPYVPKNYTDYMDHLEKKHPDGGDPRQQ